MSGPGVDAVRIDALPAVLGGDDLRAAHPPSLNSVPVALFSNV
jgi:hypothetical protein